MIHHKMAERFTPLYFWSEIIKHAAGIRCPNKTIQGSLTKQEPLLTIPRPSRSGLFLVEVLRSFHWVIDGKKELAATMSNHDNHRIPETELLDCYRVDCWEISHLLNDSLPSNLDVRQSSKSLTKQAPCARQGVRGHWPISVYQKTAPSPQETEIRWTHQSGRNPTGVKTNSSSRCISCFIKALWHHPWPIR